MQKVFDFLSALDQNNNRDWFAANKAKYEEAKQIVLVFAEEILAALNQIDTSLKDVDAKKAVLRIYRDVRFSKNKNPYKNNFGIYFSCGPKEPFLAGYYIHIEPDKSFIGGGLYYPDAKTLQKVRQEIYFNHQSLRDIFKDKKFKQHFGQLDDYQLKTFPKGYDKAHEAIDLLKYTSFIVSKNYANDDVLNKPFAKDCIEKFSAMAPLVKWLNHAILNA